MSDAEQAVRDAAADIPADLWHSIGNGREAERRGSRRDRRDRAPGVGPVLSEARSLAELQTRPRAPPDGRAPPAERGRERRARRIRTPSRSNHERQPSPACAERSIAPEIFNPSCGAMKALAASNIGQYERSLALAVRLLSDRGARAFGVLARRRSSGLVRRAERPSGREGDRRRRVRLRSGTGGPLQ